MGYGNNSKYTEKAIPWIASSESSDQKQLQIENSGFVKTCDEDVLGQVVAV